MAEMTQEEEAEVDMALKKAARNPTARIARNEQAVNDGYLVGSAFATLIGSEWLNDEVMRCYLYLLQVRLPNAPLCCTRLPCGHRVDIRTQQRLLAVETTFEMFLVLSGALEMSASVWV